MAGFELVDGYNPGDDASKQDLIGSLPGIWGSSLGASRSRAAQAASADPQVMARFGSGVDRIDVAGAIENGIAVTTTPHGNAPTVTDFTIGPLLAGAGQEPSKVRVCAGRRVALGPPFAEFAGSTVGLLGLVRMAASSLKRLSGFRCRVLACEPLLDNAAVDDFGVEDGFLCGVPGDVLTGNIAAHRFGKVRGALAEGRILDKCVNPSVLTAHDATPHPQSSTPLYHRRR